MTDKKDSKIRSADDLIVQDEAAKLGKPIPDVPKAETKEPEQDKKESVEVAQENTEDATPEADKSEEGEKLESQQKEPEVTEETEASDETSDEVDDYGTKVNKKKLYTEEQVQRMIRERVKKLDHSDSIQQAAKDFKPDPESEESWEKQLETFIDQTIEKREAKLRDREWRQREEQTQAEFEVKFTSGMDKYSDFAQVVGNKPITNAMMLATRSMKDPAAFVYAACKQQPKELERIAQIQDPVAQATEIGRLEERMKKARKIPSSPKPITKLSGDASSEMPQLDIDARIAQHAKSKIMR